VYLYLDKFALGSFKNTKFYDLVIFTMKLIDLFRFNIRKILNLPHKKSIRNWTFSINTKPGFFSEVLHALKSLAPEDKNYNIIFDATSIKKQLFGT